MQPLIDALEVGMNFDEKTQCIRTVQNTTLEIILIAKQYILIKEG